ncbi:hypothetical protein IBE52_07580 [Francisella philomiragia]|uniref:Uncharacterized protein n=2 Tax=Francisella philomiragia TaxID=28110 RepID=A0ABS1GD63_9GAMM|nr:hypothetical protein [Francisella philomiragia]MBK2302773.1 hypothetical protein [Francisella philomiragia]
MKIFKVLSLFFMIILPISIYANNGYTILSINNKVDIPLPKDMQRLVVLDGGVYAAVMSDKKGDNIYYGTISLDELKELGAKDSVYKFLNNSYNSSSSKPRNRFEAILIKGEFIDADNPNVKIYNYRDNNYIFDNVYSKDLDFAVLINYDPKYKDYINLIKQIKIRG